jgi:hypothetical protein
VIDTPGPQRYADAVVKELQKWFEDLHEPSLATLAREVIGKLFQSPSPTFELLLDRRGDWRLISDTDVAGRVRVACYRLNAQGVDLMAETGINALLAEATKEFR